MSSQGVGQHMIAKEQLDGIIAAAGIDGANEIYAAFWRSTDDLIATLHEALKDEDLTRAAGLAHAIKGSSLNVGAQALGEAAIALETHCKNAQCGDAIEIADHITRCLTETKRAFAVHLGDQ